jgi:hypothetical protein
MKTLSLLSCFFFFFFFFFFLSFFFFPPAREAFARGLVLVGGSNGEREEECVCVGALC